MSRMDLFLSPSFTSAMQKHLRRYGFNRSLTGSDQSGIRDVWSLGFVSFELVDEGMTGRCQIVIRIGDGAKWSFSGCPIGYAKKLVRKAAGLHRLHERMTTLEADRKK